MKISIRRATPADATALRELSIDSFVKAYAEFNTKEDMDLYLAENFSEENLVPELNNPHLVYLLGERNGELVGFAKLNLKSDAINGAVNPIEIARLYTRRELTGKGIGNRMLIAVDQFAREHHNDVIWLSVWHRNFRAVNFYQREGFRIAALTQFVLGKDIQDDFLMVRAVVPQPAETLLETERLWLRKFSPEKDADFVLKLVNSPSWLKYIGDRNVHTREQAMDYVRDRVMKGYTANGYGGYVMVLKSTGESIGNCGLFKRDVLDFPDIGYALLPEYEGKGFAIEASRAVLDYARELKMEQVLAITVPYHERSIHLLEKLGLKFAKRFYMAGDQEELCLYGITLRDEKMAEQ